MKTMDLNMDLGEGMGNDAQVMPFISSCNIACGGHYGDEETIKATLILAQKHKVKVGAHPSFEDRENFGRKYLGWSESRFRESVIMQIQRVQNECQVLGMTMNHIKMHGALYHATGNREDYASWTVALMKAQFPETILYVPAGSLLERKIKNAGLPFKSEAFADRRYHSDGTLVSRDFENAVITDVAKLVNQLAMMLHQHQVLTVEESLFKIDAKTYCIHGDNEAIMSQFNEVMTQLNRNGIQIGS